MQISADHPHFGFFSVCQLSGAPTLSDVGRSRSMLKAGLKPERGLRVSNRVRQDARLFQIAQRKAGRTVDLIETTWAL